MARIFIPLVLAWLVAVPLTASGDMTTRQDVLEFADSYEVINLEVPESATRWEAFSLDIPFGGQTYSVSLEPYSPRAAQHKLVIGSSSGYREEQAPAPTTFRGSTAGTEGLNAAFSVRGGVLRGLIKLGELEKLTIEPAWRYVEGAPAGASVVKYFSGTKQRNVTCGIDAEFIEGQRRVELEIQSRTAPQPMLAPIPNDLFRENDPDLRGQLATRPHRGRSTRGPASNEVWLIVDSDLQYYQVHDSNLALAVEDMDLKMTAVNNIYINDVDTEHVTYRTIIRRDDPAPYFSNVPTVMLELEMLPYWESIPQSVWPRDAVHLFTGKNTATTTIGLAYLEVMCDADNAPEYGWSEHSAANGAVGFATTTVAHELGHNWACEHCNEGGSNNLTPDCCANNVMCSFVNSTTVFSAASIGIINGHRGTYCTNRVGQPLPDTPVDTPLGAALLIVGLSGALWVVLRSRDQVTS